MMMKPSTLFAAAAVLASGVATSACVEAEPEVGTTDEAVIKCPKTWGCGENSPVMDVWEFHELNVNGLPNEAGVRVLGLYRKGDSYRPVVTGAELTARSNNPAAYKDLTGFDLEGAYFEVSAPGAAYPLRIHIKQVNLTTKYWVGDPDANYTYELEYEYTDPGSTHPVTNLCWNPPEESTQFPNAIEALLFAGDRYDAVTKEVTTTNDQDGWFNIGCAGSALAKMHLTRHTTAGATPKLDAGWDARQALLKMYVSDVCGTGHAFTEQGTPLHWENVDAWMTLTGDESSYEAVWSEKGAICLDQHRLEKKYPGLTADIAATCQAAGKPLPPCTGAPGFPAAWPGGAQVLSANP